MPSTGRTAHPALPNEREDAPSDPMLRSTLFDTRPVP